MKLSTNGTTNERDFAKITLSRCERHEESIKKLEWRVLLDSQADPLPGLSSLKNWKHHH